MRYNIPNDDTGSGTISDARYWGSDGSVITLNDPESDGTPNSADSPVFQFIPTSNRVGDGYRFERCSFKIRNTVDGFVQHQGDNDELDTGFTIEEASQWYINIDGYMLSQAYLNGNSIEPYVQLLSAIENLVGAPVVSFDSIYNEFTIMSDPEVDRTTVAGADLLLTTQDVTDINTNLADLYTNEYILIETACPTA